MLRRTNSRFSSSIGGDEAQENRVFGMSIALAKRDTPLHWKRQNAGYILQLTHQTPHSSSSQRPFQGLPPCSSPKSNAEAPPGQITCRITPRSELKSIQAHRQARRPKGSETRADGLPCHPFGVAADVPSAKTDVARQMASRMSSQGDCALGIPSWLKPHVELLCFERCEPSYGIAWVLERRAENVRQI